MLNSQTKILLLIFAGFILIYLLFVGNSSSNSQIEKFDNSKEMVYDKLPEDMQELNENEIQSQYYAPTSYDGTNESVNCKGGSYKRSSYSGSKRGYSPTATWDNYFDDNNNVMANSQGQNGNFTPLDETNNNFATFISNGNNSCGSNQNCNVEDLFNPDNLLPQEKNDDWFETINEPISVKNRHLISTNRPIGINTVGTTKNGGYDLRAAPPNPKTIVSPWNNTSIDPDTNIKSIM